MATSPVDEAIEHIADRLRRLPPGCRGLFFAFCAERLLPLYDAFVSKERWGDGERLRTSLASCWGCLGGEELGCRKLPHLLAGLDQLCPHADDFDSVEVAFAQDACSCVELTVRILLGEEVDPVGISCVFEALRIGITYSRTGYIDLGGGEEAENWERVLAQDPLVLDEIAEEQAMIQLLEGSETITSELVQKVRERARAKAWNVAMLLPMVN